MRRKQFGKAALSVMICTFMFFGCSKSSTDFGSDVDSNESNGDVTATTEENAKLVEAAIASIDYNSKSYIVSETIACTISLEGTNAVLDGRGVEYKDGLLTITSGGTYEISGNLEDGQILVDADKDAVVQLILNGVEVTSSDNAPLVIAQADETFLYLEDGTTNTFTDGSDYYTKESEGSNASEESDTSEDSNSSKVTPSAAIYSKDDLAIGGSGMLVVNANCNDGIVSKDDLLLLDGTYQITAADDGMIGKDALAVKRADVTIQAGGDGMKSTRSDDVEKGFILIDSGTFQILSETDAIQSESYLYIKSGTFDITTAGGSSNAMTGQQYGGYGRRGSAYANEDTASTKALKAGVDITVNGGDFQIDAFDDAFHSNQTMTINGGTAEVSTGDDFLHATSELTVNGGSFTAIGCYEGIEGGTIIVNDGTIIINANDDGINAASGTSTEANDNFGMPPKGQQMSSTTEDTEDTGNLTPSLTITGGYIYMNAAGDGLDSNGTVSMSGGTVIVDGPVNDGNGAIDYEQSFDISGGILITAGSSGMLQAPSTSSSQYSIAVVFNSVQQAGSLVQVEDSEGNTIVTYAPAKNYSSLVISTADIKPGGTYKVFTGGSATGTLKNGYYTKENYSGGTEFKTFTISAVTTKVTSSGASEMNQQGMMGGGMPGGGRR